METNQVTATQQADKVTLTREEKEKLFHKYSEGYNRASTNAQTRLTVSAFLGSICLGIFGVFPPTTLQLHRLDPGLLLAVSLEALLGSASLFFLIMAAATSIVLVRLGDVDPSLRKSLKNDTFTEIDTQQEYILKSIIKLYDRIYRLYYLGLIAALISLPLMGLRINIVVGAFIVIALIIALACIFTSLKFIIFYKFTFRTIIPWFFKGEEL